MIDPAAGPFLFDTSAESWLARSRDPAVAGWLRRYVAAHPVQVSSITVLERIRGYAWLWRRAQPGERARIETARTAYLAALGKVWPLDSAMAVVTGELMALAPDPPTAPHRTHRWAESRQERLVRWRFDAMIAATALVSGMSLIHNNAADFESLRGAVEIQPARFPKLGPLKLIRCDSLV